jgi:SM-20-related protein
MPPSSFFHNLGLFVRDGFFDSKSCAELLSQMSAGHAEKALVAGEKPNDGILDEDFRKVLSVRVEPSAESTVADAFLKLTPILEDHFRIRLQGFEPPVFLRYGQSAFYRPHQDRNPDQANCSSNRRVSVVVFLNGRSDEPQPGLYGGGALAFYGLLEGANWEKCPFPLDAEPGLLVAFRSDLLHEVRPVTFGERFTIVTWFGE